MSSYDKFTEEVRIGSLMEKWLNRDLRYYIQPLFDPNQTHAVYGVSAEKVVDVKLSLKAKGCTKFRVVSATGKGLKIVCFKRPETV